MMEKLLGILDACVLWDAVDVEPGSVVTTSVGSKDQMV